MSILNDYKRSLREIEIADEMMASGIQEDIQIAVEEKLRAIENRDALETFIEKAVSVYLKQFEEFEVSHA